MFRLEHEHSPFPLKECGQPLPEYSDLGTYPNLAVPLGESQKITPEAFLERFWEGVSLAAPNSTPEDFKNAYQLAEELKNWQNLSQKAAVASKKALLLEDLHHFHIKKYYSGEVLPELMAPIRKAEEAYQAALPELQAACISEAEAELSGEILEAEMLEDFDSLMPAYIRLPERPNPFKLIITHYYSPNRRAVKACGYTIGPEAGGGDSGGSDWDGGGGDWGGGSDSGWGDGDGTGDVPDYLGLLIFFGVGTVTTDQNLI